MNNNKIKIEDTIKRLFEADNKQEFEKQIILLKDDLKTFINNKNEKILDYINGVTQIILNDTGAGTPAAIAAILLIIKENDPDYAKKTYGETIFNLYKGVKNIPEIKPDKTEKQTDNFIKLLLTVSEDVRSVLIFVSFHIYKMRNIDSFSENDKKQILKISKNLFIPLTHRTGLYNIKTELEEIHMKHTETEMYRFIAGKLQETKRSRDKYIKNFIKPVEELLKKEGYNFTVKGRPKSIHSIWNKMKTQNVPFEEVYDLFAIRIILKSDLKNEKTVCWNVYSLITNIYKPNPKRLRDWISAPKLSGYESLHTTVIGPEDKWVEIQIRTERMDEIAEKGPAAHWRYKTGKEGKGSDWLAKIRNEIENPSKKKENDKVKTSLYSDEILVFTPENDLKSLKKGYTLLDFAFLIHSKIGETCTGGIVNGKIQPLSYELKNGDTVKILTNKNKKPNPQWLDIAKSPRTKNKIKRALKSLTYNSADLGKEILKDKFDRLKIKFNDSSVQKTAEYFKCKTIIEFFDKIGKGNIDLQKIKQAVEFEKTKKVIEEETPENISNNIPDKISQTKSEDFLIIGENLSNTYFKLSKCCNPLPGDKIFGFVTVSKGVKIHKTSCPNAKEMLSRFPYRIIKAKWKAQNVNSIFSATILITGTDKNGIAADITKIINNEFNLKIQAVSLKSKPGGYFDGVVAVQINSRKQLGDLIRRIKMIKGINSVREKQN